MNVLIQFFLSSACFELLMFIIWKTILYMQPYMVRFPCVNASSLPGWKTYWAHLCWLSLHNCITMDGTKNV